MKLIVGLGNPGRIYVTSRHNIGFRAVRVLGKDFRAIFRRDAATRSLKAEARFAGQKIILALPLTFMNLSGQAVKALLEKYQLALADLLVICDDLDLELGRLRIRPSGSSGGHRGLQSVIDSLESQNFSRLRLGIGRAEKNNCSAKDYVLSPFSRGEISALKKMVVEATSCSRVWARQGISSSMNLFNSTQKKRLARGE